MRRQEPLNYVDTPHEWWVGPTGTGKSKKVWEEYPTHYAKREEQVVVQLHGTRHGRN